MTEKQDDPLTARVNGINAALMRLSELAFEAVTAPESKSASRQDTVDAIQSLGLLVGSIIVALSEIADSVGKLARQGERDFHSAVDQAAEIKADMKVKASGERSFIGQPRKSD